MRYHKKKYISDCLNYNFNYGFTNSKLTILDKRTNEEGYHSILEYLNEEFDLEAEESINIIMFWVGGDASEVMNLVDLQNS